LTEANNGTVLVYVFVSGVHCHDVEKITRPLKGLIRKSEQLKLVDTKPFNYMSEVVRESDPEALRLGNFKGIHSATAICKVQSEALALNDRDKDDFNDVKKCKTNAREMKTNTFSKLVPRFTPYASVFNSGTWLTLSERRMVGLPCTSTLLGLWCEILWEITVRYTITRE
jgi:hypothetical protein